jgi:hypothetical protein
VRAVGLIKDKAAESITFKERLGNDWQRAQNSIASSARNLLDIEWKELFDELKNASKKPLNIAQVANGAVATAKKNLKTPSKEGEGADEDEDEQTPE